MSEHEKHVDEETASQKSEDTHGSKEESHKSDKKKKKNKKKKHHKKHTNGTPTPTTDTQTTFNIRDILTPEQRESLDKFREEIEKQTEITLKQRDRKWLTDMCLCRYLRARNYDIDKSLKLIIGTLKWRREYKPYKIRPEDVEIEMKNNGKMYGHGMDKQGRPILYLKPGNDNTGPEHKEVKVKYLVYSMEKALSLMDEAKGVEKVMWVIDHRGTNAFAGIGMMKIAKEIVDIMQNHYPERLSIAFNCNAPWSLSMFWKIIMPMLEEVTRQKLQFLDGKKFDAILQHIDAEQLEKEYGGSHPHVYNFEDFFKLQKETFKEEQFSDEEETVSNNN